MSPVNRKGFLRIPVRRGCVSLCLSDIPHFVQEMMHFLGHQRDSLSMECRGMQLNQTRDCYHLIITTQVVRNTSAFSSNTSKAFG